MDKTIEEVSKQGNANVRTITGAVHHEINQGSDSIVQGTEQQNLQVAVATQGRVETSIGTRGGPSSNFQSLVGDPLPSSSCGPKAVRKEVPRLHHFQSTPQPQSHTTMSLPVRTKLKRKLPANQQQPNQITNSNESSRQQTFRKAKLKEKHRQDNAGKRAAQNAQLEFAMQVSRQLGALEETFRRAIRGTNPNLAIIEGGQMSGSDSGYQVCKIRRPSKHTKSGLSGNSDRSDNQYISGYDGDNDEDDLSEVSQDSYTKLPPSDK